MEILSNVISADPILFFPVRLETCFEEKNGTTFLKIRMIPDEIQLQYEVKKLTKEDLDNGRRFWIRWFIASGDELWEHEIWRQFCQDCGVNNASRIASMTRPSRLSSFRKNNGSAFSKRPYVFLDADNNQINITTVCQQIYDQLARVLISENSSSDSRLTDPVMDSFRAISALLNSISVVFDGFPYIVDYLYDKVNECVTYLAERLESIRGFYDRYPKFKKDLDAFDLVDTDYYAFCQLAEQVKEFRTNNAGKFLSMEEMVRKYLNKEDFIRKYFGPVTYASRYPIKTGVYPSPTLPLLPERFKVYARGVADGQSWSRSAVGELIPSDLQIGLDLQGKSMSFNLDDDGNITMPGALKWLVDYNEAVSVGMAVTVNIGAYKDILVSSLYVFGDARMVESRTAFKKLFKGHMYWADNFSLLKTGTPTNFIDGTRPAETLSEEELIEARYRLEVLQEGLDTPSDSDGRILSRILDIKYSETFAYALHTENMELAHARKANEVLWEYFQKKMLLPNTKLGFLSNIKEFFLQYANGRGIAPLFRIGDQPYGIVPVSDFSDLDYSAYISGSSSVSSVFEAVRAIGERWVSICEKAQLSAEGMANSGKGADQKFLQMLSQTPRSVQFGKRLYYYGPEAEAGKDNSSVTMSSPLLRELAGKGYNSGVPVKDAVADYDISDLKAAVQEQLPDLEDWQTERLVSEFMDAFSYRADIWLTAFMSFYISKKSHWRLKTGCYGWVFNLKKSKNASKTKGEYILAPSIQHALTAAVLRSSYLQTKKDDADSHLCVNLSSMRARQALRMVDGVKAGMSTGLILGADLERYLHEAHKKFKTANGEPIEMDKCIYALRKLLPQTIDIKAEDSRAKDYSMQIINGEALLNSFLEKWDNQGRVSDWLKNNAGELKWFKGLTEEVELTDKEREVLFLLVERMLDSYDALNDLLLAEGVHRLVVGDKASFAAIANFMSKGSGNLPAPAVLETPMDYAVLSHKAGIALPLTGSSSSQTVLQAADPTVNAWLTRQMGSLEHIIFHVDYTEKGIHSFFTSNLKEIGMEPVEFLHLASYPAILRQMLEIGWRACDWETRKNGTVRILTGNPAELEQGEVIPDAGTDKIHVYESDLLTESLAGLLAGSRAMRPGDLVPALVGDPVEDGLMNVRELRDRYRIVFDSLRKMHARLSAFLDSPERNAAQPLNDSQVLTLYGLVEQGTKAGLFNETVGYDPNLLLESVNLILERPLYEERVKRQLEFLERVRHFTDTLGAKLSTAEAIAATDGDTVLPMASYLEAIRTLTVKNLTVVCRFNLGSYALSFPFKNRTFDMMGRDFTNAQNLKGDEFVDWMDEISEVRPGMKRYHDLRMLREMQSEPDDAQRTGIFQTQSGDKVVPEWMGCKFSGESILDDTDSLVMFDRQNFQEGYNNAGLIFDSWLEYIPFRKQTAGLVYRADIPDAEAPQAILYAIYPKLKTGKPWTDSEMVDVFRWAEKLMKIRTVDPDQIFESEENSILGSLLSARTQDLSDSNVSKESDLVLNPNG